MEKSGKNISVDEFQSVDGNTVVVPIESPLYEKQDLTILRNTNNSSSNSSLQIAQADAALQATEPNNPAELIEEDEQTQAKGDIFAGSFEDVGAPVLLGGAGAALLVGGLAAGGGGSSGATNAQGAGSDPVPTSAPTQQPTETPTFQPLPGSGGSPSPTNAPTAEPTNAPTQQPTEAPTGGPALGDGFAVPSFGAIPFGLPLPASPGEETSGIENGGFSYSLGEFGVAGVSGLKAGSFRLDPENIQDTEVTVIDPEIALFPRGGDNSTAVLYVRDVDLLAGVSIESATDLVERVFTDLSAADPQAIGTYTNVLDVPLEGDPSTLSLKVGTLSADVSPVVNVDDLTINLSAAGVVESIGSLAAFLQSNPQPGDFLPSGGFDAPNGGRYAFPEGGGDLPMPDLGGGGIPIPTEEPTEPPGGGGGEDPPEAGNTGTVRFIDTGVANAVKVGFDSAYSITEDSLVAQSYLTEGFGNAVIATGDFSIGVVSVGGLVLNDIFNILREENMSYEEKLGTFAEDAQTNYGAAFGEVAGEYMDSYTDADREGSMANSFAGAATSVENAAGTIAGIPEGLAAGFQGGGDENEGGFNPDNFNPQSEDFNPQAGFEGLAAEVMGQAPDQGDYQPGEETAGALLDGVARGTQLVGYAGSEEADGQQFGLLYTQEVAGQVANAALVDVNAGLTLAADGITIGAEAFQAAFAQGDEDMDNEDQVPPGSVEDGALAAQIRTGTDTFYDAAEQVAIATTGFAPEQVQGGYEAFSGAVLDGAQTVSDTLIGAIPEMEEDMEEEDSNPQDQLEGVIGDFADMFAPSQDDPSPQEQLEGAIGDFADMFAPSEGDPSPQEQLEGALANAPGQEEFTAGMEAFGEWAGMASTAVEGGIAQLQGIPEMFMQG